MRSWINNKKNAQIQIISIMCQQSSKNKELCNSYQCYGQAFYAIDSQFLFIV